MKKLVCILLALSIGSFAVAGRGRTLKEGSIEIQINAKPVASLMSRGKTDELEEKLTDGRRIKTLVKELKGIGPCTTVELSLNHVSGKAPLLCGIEVVPEQKRR